MKKPTILITNDDGVNAPGIRALIDFVRPFGKVVVVAPDKPMSGMSHAVTMTTPLRLQCITKDNDYEEYCCTGTPVDSVKMGEKLVLRHKPDLVLSGINHGSNASINVIYSGTMGAVIETALSGIPSIGFSLADYSPAADFSVCEPFVKQITTMVLSKGLPEGVCLNVNIPPVNGKAIRGVKICRQAKAYWDEVFDERKDPHQQDYFWLSGQFRTTDPADDTDEWALANHYVALTPIDVDFTAHHFIKELNTWKFNS